jgi:WD40 repeat protein
MRQRSIDFALNSAVDKFCTVSKGARCAKRSLWSMERTCLIVAGIMVLAWFSSDDSSQEPIRMRLARGEAGVMTLGFACSPDGKTVATVDTTGRVAIWNQEDDWQISRFLDYDRKAWSAAFSPDGRLLAVGADSEILVYDLLSDRAVRSLNSPAGQTKTLAFSPDGNTLAATTARNAEIILFDLATSRQRTTFLGDFPAVSIAFSPDGRFLASGARDKKIVRLWDLETGRSRSLFKDVMGPITSVAFSCDGSLVAAACSIDPLVRLWDVNSGRLWRQLEGHTGGTNTVSFSPDGVTLTTSGNDGFVKLWRVATGEQLASLDAQSSWLPNLAFSRDGRTLFATGSDNDIRVWDMEDVLRRNPSGQANRAPPDPF